MKRKKKFSNSRAAKRRLRRLLAVFFIALAIPVYLLLDRVYTQLENEAFFTQRNQAAKLVEEIERRLIDLLQQEQERPIAEYSFSARTSRCLQLAGITTIAQLVQKTEPDLLHIRNQIGRASCRERV